MISSTSFHLWWTSAEIGWRVLANPSKFQRVSRVGFVILHRRRSMEANQTLHDVWPSPGLVHYIQIWRHLFPGGILWVATFTLGLSLVFYCICWQRDCMDGAPLLGQCNSCTIAIATANCYRQAAIYIVERYYILLDFAQLFRNLLYGLLY